MDLDTFEYKLYNFGKYLDLRFILFFPIVCRQICDFEILIDFIPNQIVFKCSQLPNGWQRRVCSHSLESEVPKITYP